MTNKKQRLASVFFTDRAQAVWKKLNHLDAIKFELNSDIEDKTESIRIDKENLELDYTCANISYKPAAMIADRTK